MLSVGSSNYPVGWKERQSEGQGRVSGCLAAGDSAIVARLPIMGQIVCFGGPDVETSANKQLNANMKHFAEFHLFGKKLKAEIILEFWILIGPRVSSNS